nr:hypothetical protein [Bacteroidales bacterium]
MNKDTFKTKELIFYKIPIMVVDLFLILVLFLFLRSVFDFQQTADTILLKNRTIYFLVVSFLLAKLLLPVRLNERGVGPKMIVREAFLLAFVSLILFALSNHILFDIFAGRFYLLFGTVLVLTLTIWYSIVVACIGLARKYGRNKVHCVIVGSDEVALNLYRELTEGYAYNDYRVLGFLTDDKDEIPAGATWLGPLSSASEYLASNKVHNVYCSINPATRTDVVNSIIHDCEHLFIDFFYVPNMDGYIRRSLTYSEVGSVTVVNLREEPLQNPLNAF